MKNFNLYVSAELSKSVKANDLKSAVKILGLTKPVFHQNGESCHQWYGSTAYEIVEE
ncbi:hypothetical protein N9043_01880 [bacterium]|nr:hypothetical protein [bacterium]